MKNLKIMRKQVKNGFTGKYLIVNFCNSDFDRFEFIDRKESRFNFYKNGSHCDISLLIDFPCGGFTTEIINAKKRRYRR